MVKIACIVVVFYTQACFAQKNLFMEAEQRLSDLSERVYSAPNDTLKLQANAALIDELYQLISHKKSLRYSFTKLDHISILQPKDKSFRLITWALQYDNQLVQYFGFIHYYDRKQRAQVVHRLRDRSHAQKNVEIKTFTTDNWFGALYYKLIENEHNDRKYYTLLAWDGNDAKTNKKIIDVLWFDNKKTPLFGAPLFVSKSGIKNRYVMEFNELASVTLEYKAKSGIILFDDLQPVDGESTRIKSAIVPTLNYNGFMFKKGKWNFLERLEPTEL